MSLGELTATAFALTDETPAECMLEPTEDQTYRLHLRPKVAGKHEVDIKFNENHIPGNWFICSQMFSEKCIYPRSNKTLSFLSIGLLGNI